MVPGFTDCSVYQKLVGWEAGRGVKPEDLSKMCQCGLKPEHTIGFHKAVEKMQGWKK